MLFWLGENWSRATFDAFFNLIKPIKWPRPLTLTSKYFFNVINLLIAFGLIDIDSKFIRFVQVGVDICNFIDLSLGIRGHLGNLQIKNCHG